MKVHTTLFLPTTPPFVFRCFQKDSSANLRRNLGATRSVLASPGHMMLLQADDEPSLARY